MIEQDVEVKASFRTIQVALAGVGSMRHPNLHY